MKTKFFTKMACCVTGMGLATSGVGAGPSSFDGGSLTRLPEIKARLFVVESHIAQVSRDLQKAELQVAKAKAQVAAAKMPRPTIVPVATPKGAQITVAGVGPVTPAAPIGIGAALRHRTDLMSRLGDLYREQMELKDLEASLEIPR